MSYAIFPSDLTPCKEEKKSVFSADQLPFQFLPLFPYFLCSNIDFFGTKIGKRKKTDGRPISFLYGQTTLCSLI